MHNLLMFPGVIRWIMAIVVLAGGLTGCRGTLDVTPEPTPKLPPNPIHAKLGIHVFGDSLKKTFAGADRQKLGLASGQYFRDVILLPDETRYIAPQDIYEQFGTDLILQISLVDTRLGSDMNAYMYGMPIMMWFTPLAPILTTEITHTLEANVRDAQSGRLLWAKTEAFTATDHFSPIGPEQKIADLTTRGLHSAVVKIFDGLKVELAAYQPGTSMKLATKPGSKPSSPASVSKANRYAIVIGIEQYRERVPKADFAVQDAKDVAQFLSAAAGYREENVILRLNEQATKSDLEKYFEGWLKNNVDANSSLLIYFSGHGAPQPATGDAYLVPYDGDPAFIEQTGYPLKRLYQTLEKLPTKNIVVMLDSCFSGAGGRSVLAKGARPMVLTVEGMAASSKAVVLTATSGSHLSLADQERKHGLFTYYALQGLEGEADANGDGSIDVQELFEYLKPQVQRIARRTYNTEQVPQLIIPAALAVQSPPRIVER
jgi:hypothetical protein